MAGYTDYDFEQELDADLGWRRIELSQLKNALANAARASKESPASRGLSRAMIVMCYAHWEGYTKNALERYARLVAKRKPSLSRANDGFVIQHIGRMMNRIASGDGSARAELLATLRGDHDPRIQVDRALLSDAKSNLRFEVLTRLFELGCISVRPFELKANLIDVHLCDRRNSVAHGRDFFVPPQDAMSLCDEVFELVEAVRDVMVNQVRAQGYLLPASPQSGGVP